MGTPYRPHTDKPRSQKHDQRVTVQPSASCHRHQAMQSLMHLYQNAFLRTLQLRAKSWAELLRRLIFLYKNVCGGMHHPAMLY